VVGDLITNSSKFAFSEKSLGIHSCIRASDYSFLNNLAGARNLGSIEFSLLPETQFLNSTGQGAQSRFNSENLN